MELSSCLIKQRKTKLLSGALQPQVNQNQSSPSLRGPQRCPIFLQDASLATGSSHNGRDPQQISCLSCAIREGRKSDGWKSFYWSNRDLRWGVISPPGVQQGCYKLAVLTFSPGFRSKHTLQPAHPCFAGHSPQDEILMASWKSNIIRMLPWS